MKVGFLMFHVGLNITLQRNCYQTLVPEIPFLERTATLSCKSNQHGNLAEKQCWNRLMLLKVEAIANSPFDITIAIDTDVWPTKNKKKWLKRHIVSVASRHAFSGVIDPWVGDKIVVEPSYNGGFLIVKKCREMDAFWADVIQFLNNNPTAYEQYSYFFVLPRHPDLNASYLHNSWSCADDVNCGMRESHCLFRHSHSITDCQA